MKRTLRKRALIGLVFILIISLIMAIVSLVKSLLSLSDDTMISMTLSAFESVGLLVSLIIAINQLNDSKEIARADFLVELNKAFTENQGNMELYTALQDCLDGKCDGCDGGEGVCNLSFPKVMVSNYLTFFETVYLLLCNGVLSFEMIDDLFGYRFFLAVHSKFVQQSKLASQPENFKNIFCLEYEWLRYRELKAHKKDKEKSVYRTRQLKNLMVTPEQKEIYEKWLKERKKLV